MNQKIFALLMISIFPLCGHAVDPSIDWQVLRTPRFEVIYQADQKDLAQVYAVASEQAYQI